MASSPAESLGVRLIRMNVSSLSLAFASNNANVGLAFIPLLLFSLLIATHYAAVSAHHITPCIGVRLGSSSLEYGLVGQIGSLLR